MESPVVHYYQSRGSRLGYRFIQHGVKHFGLYPNGRRDITEAAAQTQLHRMLVQELAVQPNANILDAGCGEGAVAVDVATLTRAHVTGITIVPFEVPMAVQRSERVGTIDQTTFIEMDYSHQTFPNNTFDGGYAVETLCHSPNIQQTAAELFRVLKPNTKFVVFDYGLADQSQFTPAEQRAFDIVVRGTSMTSLPLFRFDKLSGYFQTAGFTDVTERDLTNEATPSLERLYRLARWPYAFVHLLKLEHHFTNMTAAAAFYPMVRRGLIRFTMLTARKPV